MKRVLAISILCAGVLAGQTPTTVTLTSSANPSIFGQTIILSAQVTPAQATGRVSFYDGAAPLGVASVAAGRAALATILTSPGARKLTARFTGSGVYSPSASPVFSQTVSPTPASTFQTASAFTTANAINQHIAVADFNGDGHLDIVANNYSVLMGNGDGTFQKAVTYSFPTSAYAVVTGDFNGDGKPDFATARLDGEVDVWLNKGDGTFGTPLATQVGTAPRDLTVGDFNNDGIADIAIASRQGQKTGVGVLIGVGDGTFQPMVNYLAGHAQTAVRVADFNGDGNADIVSVGGDPDAVTAVLFGVGDGTFRTSLFSFNFFGENLAVADFDHDGRLDFAVSGVGNTIGIYLPNGDGTFRVPTPLPVTKTTNSLQYGITAGDFDGDGNPDIA